MPYRCQICKDCSDTEGFYQSDRDYPSDVSDSDTEYYRGRWRVRSSHRITYQHHRGSERRGYRSRSEREEGRSGRRWRGGESNVGRNYRRRHDWENGGKNSYNYEENGSEGNYYRRSEKYSSASNDNDIYVRNAFNRGGESDGKSSRAGSVSDNENDVKDNSENHIKSNRESNDTNNSEASRYDSGSDSTSKQNEDNTTEQANISAHKVLKTEEGDTEIVKAQDSDRDWLKTSETAKEDGNRGVNKPEGDSESSYTTDSESFWDCSSASESETDTGSESNEEEKDATQDASRKKRAISYNQRRHRGGNHNIHKKDSGKSRKRRSLNISYVKMPSGKKYPISSPKPEEFQCGTETKKITLHPKGRVSGHEYKIVEKEMQKSIVQHVNCINQGGCFMKYEIVKIEKLINGCLWKRYRHYQQDVIDEHHYANQRMLFHGSSKVDDIVNTGFDERYSNFNGMFGAGLYFAKHSSKANQYAFGFMGGTGCPLHSDKNCHVCERKILLCRVTLGRSKKYYTKQSLAHSPRNHNSVVGVPSDKKGGLKFPEYIVYRGEQIYPEYLITYKIKD